ncbi:hypothetical protein TSOC_004993 [Tetrabaena socialis]|uniref:PHD-type domain-containing protein n=1 Tax=Tetrabaena socialis TaxID=47790 RepID=A0A2J8A7A7_9CHLO|nr:hypothetical protein TSOC_004993 [Tetrabaena socialis]|eukprot:PNH08426.1 hypothetical protein TSOC_004993 [Tetrabaena socialis]
MERFEPGDYVYVLQRNRVSTLQLPTLEHVLRVVSVTPEGVATLVGRCGTTSKESVSNLAFCHLSNIDPIIDPRVAIPAADLACERCGFPNHEDKMLLCDGCGTGWHLYCLQPRYRLYLPARGSAPVAPLRASPQPISRLASGAAKRSASSIERRFPDPLTLARREQRGVVRFRSTELPGEVFEATYEGGGTELLSLRQVKAALCPVRPVLLSQVLPALPERWDLSTAAGVRLALAHPMPGCGLSEAHLNRLALRVPGGRSSLQASGEPECVATLPEEVEPLLRCVDFSRCTAVFEPWNGTGVISRVLQAHGLRVLRNDVNPRHEADWHADALQPGLYQHLQRVQSYQAIIASPWFAVLGIALPLAVRYAPVVAFHVPGHFVTNAPPGRRLYLAALALAGRVSLILGLPRGPSGPRCLWLVVFELAALRARLLRLPVAPEDPWVL